MDRDQKLQHARQARNLFRAAKRIQNANEQRQMVVDALDEMGQFLEAPGRSRYDVNTDEVVPYTFDEYKAEVLAGRISMDEELPSFALEMDALIEQLQRGGRRRKTRKARKSTRKGRRATRK